MSDEESLGRHWRFVTPSPPPSPPPSLVVSSVEDSPRSIHSSYSTSAHNGSITASSGASNEPSVSRSSHPNSDQLENWMERPLGNLEKLACGGSPQSLIE